MQILKVWALILLMAMALPACANFSTYSQKPGSYFSDPVQLALAEAAGRGDLEAMQQALDAGADPNALGEDGMTPLFWSVTMEANIEAFRYMLSHGGDPNLVVVDEDKPGTSTIYLIYQAYRNPDPAFIEAALEAGADPDTEIHEQSTLFFESMTDEYIDQIKLLIAYGADVSYPGQFDYTPLYQAVIGDEYQTALALLDAGADPEIENTNKSSAISAIKNFHDRKGGETYRALIDALKEKGYLDESF
ncbi:ankyrin repeat domain-containing protein [Vreelandella sp. EE27]